MKITLVKNKNPKCEIKRKMNVYVINDKQNFVQFYGDPSIFLRKRAIVKHFSLG